MKREFSAGGLVFNKQGQILVIQPTGHDYWMFPKGHLDEGETTKEAALREVQEETGAEAEIVEKIGDTKYVYTWEGEKRFKVVTWFLMNYISGDITKHSWETSDVRWVEPEKALGMLSFAGDKGLLKQALEKKNGK